VPLFDIAVKLEPGPVPMNRDRARFGDTYVDTSFGNRIHLVEFPAIADGKKEAMKSDRG